MLYLPHMSNEPEPRRSVSISIPVRMPRELDALISATAAAVKLSKQDTIRLSLERGVEILKRQLNPTA